MERAIDPEAALAAASGYSKGQSRKALFAVEELVRSSARGDGGAPSRARREVAARLADALSGSVTKDAKEFFLKQLSFVGTEKEAAALAPLLLEGDLSYMARYALERIPGPAAAEVLLGALGKSSGKIRVGIVNSLGDRRVRGAARELIAFLGDPDEELAGAAAAALGKIGWEDAAKALAEALAKASGDRRARIADACLGCAERFLSKGKRSSAAEIYRRLDAPEEAAQVRLAARRELAGLGEAAPPGPPAAK